MRTLYLVFNALLCLLFTLTSHAQHVFVDTNLGAYRQNFDSQNGDLTLNGNQVTAFPEVYTEADFAGTNYRPTTIYANDGSFPNASYYNFGDLSGPTINDRALGGIGGFASSTSATPGIGHLGIRLKNGSSQMIKNLAVGYAMEQWYNSTFTTAATIVVSYQVSSSPITSLVDGTWTTVSALGAAAPSTSTSIGARDGNAASNRQLRNTILENINLDVDQEIMFRWSYALNSNTNGNGLSVDDVVITPETNIFYSKTTGSLDVLANWGTSTDGTGTAPSSFTAPNQTFYVMSATSSAPNTDRIGGTVWTVSGANSKIVVGTEAAPAALRVDFNSNIAALINVSKGSYFLNQRSDAPAFTLGTLATTSTVEYLSGSTSHNVTPNQYGNLKIKGVNADRSKNPKMLAGDIIVAGELSIESGSNLVLGDYDVTILNGGKILNTSATAYLVANGSGQLRMPVPRAINSTTPGTSVLFPVGSSFTSYTPVTLQQTSATSDNVFEVRLLDNAYSTYNASTYQPGPARVTTSVVNKTWLISKEVVGNATTVTMKLQWNAGESTANFVNANAHINHYTSGAWDTNKTQVGVTGTGPFVATRTGITSFSPFGISSRIEGALPVELVRFEAKRQGSSVACTWATATEKNNDYFLVERSPNGVEFSQLDKVNGAGSSTTPHSYSFVDRNPLASIAYYRLRQTDLDGTTTFSPVVVVEAETTARTRATAVPNPSTGKFELVGISNVTRVEVTNILGAHVCASVAPDAKTGVWVDLSEQPAGIYLLQLQTNAGTQVVRVVKE